MKLPLEIEVEYDGDFNDPEEFECFRDMVLLNSQEDEGLFLHSNYLGDEVGPVKVTKIFGWAFSPVATKGEPTV